MHTKGFDAQRMFASHMALQRITTRYIRSSAFDITQQWEATL